MGITRIEWADKTWNPITGCTKCGPACANCYAERDHTKRHKAYLAGKLQNMPCYAKPFDQVRFLPERLAQLQVGGEPRRFFACSVSDLFHPDVREEWQRAIFQAFAARPRHTFCVLTKRWGQMRDFVASHKPDYVHSTWPLPNVLHGATVWDQPSMDAAAKHLLKMPIGARLFLSVEPMLGPVVIPAELLARLSWVICGGETGTGARPMHPDWTRSLRDQCQSAGVAFFFKQWGEWAERHALQCNEPGIKGKLWHNFDPDTSVCRVGKMRAGRGLDGRTWNEVPA